MAPCRDHTPLRCSGMACVVEGSHSLPNFWLWCSCGCRWTDYKRSKVTARPNAVLWWRHTDRRWTIKDHL